MEMQMSGSYVAIVVVTGLIVVFIVLILLIWIVQIMGKIFSSIDKSKGNNPGDDAKKKIDTAVNNTPAPIVEDGISDEIVAVIAAAVASVMGTGYAIKSVKKSVDKSSSRRTAWGTQGVIENTRVF